MNSINLDKIKNNNFREAVTKAYSRFTRIQIRTNVQDILYYMTILMMMIIAPNSHVRIRIRVNRE